MSAQAFASGTSWSWPKQEPASAAQETEATLPGSFPSNKWGNEVEEDVSKEEPEQSAPKEETRKAPEPPKSRRHYPPRTCRICFEVVNPTFEPATQGLTGMLNPTPRVRYISDEPESGRLIRPCKCKGSQQYVHEGCLQAWRHADPAYGRRNYWECPTCKFKYRLERMRWSRWISSTLTQIVLTVSILFATIFLLGFVADPIIDFYLDPMETLAHPFTSRTEFYVPEPESQSSSKWIEHLLKGLASLGLLGFIKIMFAMSPFQWYNLRNAGILGGGRNARVGTGRDRLGNISWWLVMLGVVTFLYAIWKGVRAWSRRALERAGERVSDVQGADEEVVEDDPIRAPSGDTDAPEASGT